MSVEHFSLLTRVALAPSFSPYASGYCSSPSKRDDNEHDHPWRTTFTAVPHSNQTNKPMKPNTLDLIGNRQLVLDFVTKRP